MKKDKSSKRKIKFRPSSTQILVVAVAIIIITYMAIRLLPADTLFIYSDRYVYSENADLYIFKQEEYVIIHNSVPIEFNVDEGEKIAGSTELSSNYKISGDAYIRQKIKAIDYILNRSPKFQTKEEIYGEVQLLDSRINEINGLLVSTWTDLNESERARYLVELDELGDQRQIILRSVQYIYTPDEELGNIKKSCNSLLGNKQVALNAYNLNLSIYGNIYFSLDGYEDVMTFHNIENFDHEYLEYLKGYVPKKQISEDDKYIIKSSASDKILLALSVDNDCYIENETECKELYKSNTIRYDMDKQGGYYEFLFRRIDILSYYPKMTVSFGNSENIAGYLVNVIESESDKILIVAVRDNIKFIQQQNRVSKIKFEAQGFNAFVVPNTAVVKHDSNEYVTVLTNSNIKKSVKVTVYDYVDRNAILRVSANSDLKDGDEILVVGEYVND